MVAALKVTAQIGSLDSGDQSSAFSEREALNMPISTFYEFSEVDLMQKIDEIKDVLIFRKPHLAQLIEEDYRQTIEFINKSFRFFNGEKDIEGLEDLYEAVSRAKAVFIVPARGGFSSEASQFLPLLGRLDPTNNKGDEVLFKDVLNKIPPTIMATQDVDGDTVLTIYCPIDLNEFDNLMETYKRPGVMNMKNAKGLPGKISSAIRNPAGAINAIKLEEQFRKAKEVLVNRINETLLFADRVSGGAIRVAGLGAALPSLSGGGEKINNDLQNQIAITTGHSTTIASMITTYETIYQGTKFRENGLPRDIGIVGGGYIGRAMATNILAKDEQATVYIYDINIAKSVILAEELNAKFASDKSKPRAIVLSDLNGIILNTDIIASATTSPIDFSSLSDEAMNSLELKIFIDDSEPMSVGFGFGIAVKPTSKIKFKGEPTNRVFLRKIVRYGNWMNHLSTYDYGLQEGIPGPGISRETLFGCNAEVILALRQIQCGFESTIPHKGRVDEESMENFWISLSQIGDIVVEEGSLECFGLNVSERIRTTSARRLNSARTRKDIGLRIGKYKFIAGFTTMPEA